MVGDHVIGLDVGTSNVRSHVYNIEGEVMGSAADKVDILSPKPGWAEIDPEKLWNKVLEVLRESIREAGLNGNNVASIGISSQRGTFTIWSRKTGKPFFNFITWQDLRGADLVKSWNQSITMRAFRIGGKLLHWVTRKARFKATGILRLSNDMVTMRLLWVMQNIPSVKKAVEAGDAMFGCVESWLLYKMTERQVSQQQDFLTHSL